MAAAAFTSDGRRVLTLNPDNKIKASVQAKLASPLGPEGPPAKMAGE